MIYPASFEQKIGFLTLREQLRERCLSPLGREEVDQISFLTDYNTMMSRLNETAEMMIILSEESDTWPVNFYMDVREWLSRLRVEGTFPIESELFDLQRSLQTIHALVHFFTRQQENRYPGLTLRVEGIGLFPNVLKQLDQLLTINGVLKDNASPELARIRHDLFQVQNGISRKLATILRQAQEEGFVDKEASPTMRDGRLVIPVSPAYKRKVRGIVHDESATGKTIFIEPAEVVEANNRVRELQSEERREKIRILTAFANFIRPQLIELQMAYQVLGVFDAIRAKALLAMNQNAIVPRVDQGCLVDWHRAVHPLLADTLKKQQREIIPLDIQLDEKQHVVLISGPNAGGKSVCLKTVGLLQYMVQCGLPVPVHESSRFGMFNHLFLDIGDEQSIEDDLSTYSSHLKHMNYFLRKGDAQTLVLIDELGAGTEPQLGGAIAEAVLHRLVTNGVFGVVTTHYTNLKQFADTAEGVVNGAMMFDRQHLQPLYQLQIGFPGSSFALEIARKIGLSEEVIQEATDKAGNAHVDLETYVQAILRDKRYWETKRQKIHQQEKRLDEMIARHETDQDQLKSQRKEFIANAKQEATQLLNEANAMIENTIRRIKESSAEREITREVRKELDIFRQKVTAQPDTEMSSSKSVRSSRQPAIHKKSTTPKELPIEAGDFVRLNGHASTGEVIEVQGDNITIAFGNLKSTLKRDRLERISKNQVKEWAKKSSTSGITADEAMRQRKLSFRPDIDVRGMRGEEALLAVQYFLDDALMVGVERVRILHGTGNGILRQLIRQYLATVPGVNHFADEHIQFGGAGITVVEL
jgi:DNA mismatch repair protein MutS2